MHSKSFHCISIQQLETVLTGLEQPDLIQFYANTDIIETRDWVNLLTHYCPNACRIGMSSEKQIFNGQPQTKGVTLICSYFNATTLIHNCAPIGKDQLNQSCHTLFEPVNEHKGEAIPAGIVLADDLSISSSSLFSQVNTHKTKFCGGLSGLHSSNQTWVLYQDQLLQEHAVLVAFASDKLVIENDAFVDSIDIGKKMRVTAMQDNILQQIDHLPAQQVFNRYLGNGSSTDIKVMNLFALKYKTSHKETHSVPLSFAENGGIIMSEPLPVGAQIKFVYFHPWPSLQGSLEKLNLLYQHPPESIFTFNCISRDQDPILNENSKLKLLSQVQELNGTYCYGEFFTSDTSTKSLQHALTYIGLSETPNEVRQKQGSIKAQASDDSLSAIFNLMNNVFNDLSQERDALIHLSKHTDSDSNDWLYDPQTGLMNRFALLSRLQSAEENDHKTHLTLFRIRNFRLINEQYGYDVADDLLAQLSLYLKNRMGDTFLSLDFSCYRVSANEVAVLLQTDMPPRKVNKFMEKLSEDVESSPFFTTSQATDEISISLSVGLASIFSSTGNLLCKKEHLLIKANEARRQAHETNHLTFWNGDLDLVDQQKDNLNWIVKIKQALDEGNIFPYIQPYFDAKTGKCVGGEALIRAKIDNEIIGPASFLDLIKQTQLYPKLTIKVLETCGQLLRRDPNSHLALNLSVMDFKHVSTLKALRQFFRENDVKGRLILEITESESIHDYQWITSIVSEFREAGALLAIDDFGSGYSNLEKLIELQPDVLKLDGSIIRTIDVDPKLQILVRHINSLAHSLGIKTQAEFVHNQAVQDILVDMGVDYLQGFHLSKPISIQAWNQYSTDSLIKP
ncbi:GGDEF family protein [Marinomonas sp. MED121]|uniref:bifunctional diguanylate cyclase/phosphodiesterase n=1 Tax=Marinomonas sp. MED121 TaxID=314277 RepID=UPI0000691129|nr:EAL domain-containing protein [Marinomonas sp. MED121]EAQ67809.1 GGDEF family protein [Marinomonas sp. MED121]